MGDLKESTNRTGTNTVRQYSIRTNTSDGKTGITDNNQSNSYSNWGQQGDNKIKNGESATTSTANTYFRGEIETFGAVLTLRYERVDLNKSFKVFRKRLINYAIKEIKNSEDIMMLIQDLKYPKSLLSFNNKTKDLTLEEERLDVNK